MEDFSWWDYERSWKSDAIWVDLRPVRDRIKYAERFRPGRNNDYRAVDTCGLVAAAVLLGGKIATKNVHGPDLTLASEDAFEVRTSTWGGSKKYNPTMLSGRRGSQSEKQKELPAIWCVTGRYPHCYDGAWVAGVLNPDAYVENRKPGAGKFKWAWVVRWADDGRFRHIAELMQDELENPHLPVGMPYRKNADDIGSLEYLLSYGFLGAAGDGQAEHAEE